MTLGAQRSIDGAPAPATPSSLVVIASSTEMHRRIASAIEGQGLRASTQIDTPDGITELDTDASTIVVLVCDVDGPREMAGLRRLRREARQLAVVVISPPATGTGIRRALDAGADAVVFDSELELTLATAVHAVSIGQSVVPRRLRASVKRPVLSHREQQVLTLVRTGLTNAQIAERLFLAESTIKSHLSSIFTKFGVRSRKEVAAALIDIESVAAVSGDHPSGRATA